MGQRSEVRGQNEARNSCRVMARTDWSVAGNCGPFQQFKPATLVDLLAREMKTGHLNGISVTSGVL